MATDTQPLKTAESEDRISFRKQLQRKKRARRIRRVAILAVVVLVFLGWITGFLSTSLTAASDLMDSIHIASLRSDGYPAQTGITEVYQLEPLSGGYLVLGGESCLVYSAGGTRLRSLQPGYARPAVAAGKTRFILYNRGGNELRVESRSQTLFTKTYDTSILLCGMAANGTMAIVREDARYLASLQICSDSMEQQLVWNMTDAEGVPMRMAFTDDGRKLAVATLLSENGQMKSNLYLLDVRKQSQVLLASESGGLPLSVSWLSGGGIRVLYDTAAVNYDANGAETARYTYDGGLSGWSLCGDKTALLLSDATSETMVLLDGTLVPLASAPASGADAITLTKTAAYTLTDTAVECYSLAGKYQWKQNYAVRPQALIESKQLLMFADGTVEVCNAPDAA